MFTGACVLEDESGYDFDVSASSPESSMKSRSSDALGAREIVVDRRVHEGSTGQIYGPTAATTAAKLPQPNHFLNGVDETDVALGARGV